MELADPGFYVPQRIDLLLGAQVFMKILLMEQQTRPGLYPVLQKTQLGWIVSGEFCNQDEKATSFPQHGFFTRQCNSINDQLQMFWELEEINTPAWSTEERECEEHFIANMSRNNQGHFVVKLPLKQELSTLMESAALRRLQRLDRRLSSDKQLHDEYHHFLDEYRKLGHMQPIPSTGQPTYFLPHHAVFKQDSTTTKTRVVFDASCKTSNNISLNDILRVGLVVQQDLCTIVLRFRNCEIAFIADINKMYRQVRIHLSNYDCQRILWLDSPADPIQEYQVNTVTNGTSSARYLATRCLQKLADDEQSNYSKGAISILKHDFYVDNCISGSSDLDSAVKLVSELQSLLTSGGFQLRKWASNSAQLLETIPREFQENQFSIEVNGNATVKVLGLRWQPAQDHLQLVSRITSSHQQFRPTNFTKRNVLATISSIFDPLGLLTPTVIRCKILMQRLWKQNLNWDDILPSNLQQDWELIYN
ncbi:uncharacterized protein LOC142320045 [Lycorma delicatula]|uniref:uncharacterized protein LOC142320045 n=1 Tax=Lycorma delicatula TaxID=130591 RepID=UPI003F510962